MTRARILVVDDKGAFLSLFRRILPADMEVVCAADGARAMDLLASQSFDVVVTDVRMPGGADGLEILQKVRESSDETAVVLMTAYGTIAEAVRAMKWGADDYLTKPFDPDDALAAIERAMDRRRQHVRARVAAPPPEPVGTGATEATEAELTPALITLTYREVVAAGRERTTREYLVALLAAAGGNVTQAAERAGVERETFHRLIKRHGIRAEDFRTRSG